MDFFNKRMCFGKFWEQQKKFWDTKFFFEIFVKKFTFWGGGGQRQFGKSLHFEFLFFLHPSLTLSAFDRVSYRTDKIVLHITFSFY